MARFLIAIISCHANCERREIVRSTWLPRIGQDIDAAFFVGRPAASAEDSVIPLDCDDDYNGLPKKVLAMLEWAAARGYERVWKVDDDVYVVPERLKWEKIPDYFGRKRGPSYEGAAKTLYGAQESSFCSGFGYSLDRRAINAVLRAAYNGDWAEDRFIGNALARAGFRAFNDPTVMLWPMTFIHNLNHRFVGECWECVRAYNAASILCPHEHGEAIPRIHESFTATGEIPTK